METALVVGAAGILAPVAATLLARGVTVTGVGRASAMAAGVSPVYVDATDEMALVEALGGSRWDVAVVYEPTTSPASLAVLRRHVRRLVLVCTSAAADPDVVGVDVVVAADTLLLGWRADGGGWHEPAEIAAAALDVLDRGAGLVLGVVRPWSDRP